MNRAHRLLAVLLLIGGAAQATPTADDAMFEALRQQDARVATISYRLLTAARPFCTVTEPLSGLAIHDAAQYARSVRAEVTAHFGLGDGPAIMAVVPGSPADKAGLRAGDWLLAINGVPFPAASAPTDADGDPEPLRAVLALLNRELQRGPVQLDVQRGMVRFSARMAGASACSSYVELVPSDVYNSWAEGRDVRITSAMAEFAQDDDELAALIAHEIAHNIRGHPALLEAAGVPKGMLRGLGRNAGRVRATEIDADYLSVYLLAAAGYEIEAAPRFWQRLGDAHGTPGLFADATHPGTRRRVALLRDAVAEVRLQQQGVLRPRPFALERKRD